MQVFLINQSSKFSIFKKVEIKDDKIILNCNIKKMKQKKKIKIARRIAQILKKSDSDTVILSKKIKEDNMFINLLNSSQINIITGKSLFKKLIEKVLKNIESERKKEDTEVAITTNCKNKWVSDLIINLSKKYKTIKVVSNNIGYFKSMQENLLEKEGIILTLTNNKRKALLKSNIIINVDFPEQMLNKYSIFEKSTIINLEENIKIHKKRFCGKIINDYKIYLKEESEISKDLRKEKYIDFDLKDLAECYLINKPEELKNVSVEF